MTDGLTLDTHFFHVHTHTDTLAGQLIESFGCFFTGRRKVAGWHFRHLPASVKTFKTCTSFHHLVCGSSVCQDTSKWTPFLDSFITRSVLVRWSDTLRGGLRICSKPLTSNMIYSCYLPIASDKAVCSPACHFPRTHTQ